VCLKSNVLSGNNNQQIWIYFMSDTVEVRRRRAQFRATHRGTKEMDWMLGKFAEAKLSEMSDPRLSAFELLLTVADLQINDWLLKPENCDTPRYIEIIADIREFHGMSRIA